MSLQGKRVLYISYNGMLDPLGQSQVIPYLRELSRDGVSFTLLSFERPEVLKGRPEAAKLLKNELAASGIEWHFLKYHKRPSIPATSFDVLNGVRKALSLARKRGVDAVHARGHIPAAIALRVKSAFNCRFIFDIRGLMADEYVDAGHWRERSVPWRMTKALERRALFAADGVVTLTDRIWPIINKWEGLAGRSVEHIVVPCCADLNRFRFDPDAREKVRSELKLKGKFVVVYSGSIGGWYLNEEMADFFAYMLKSRANSHALWLTPTGHSELQRLMESRGISPDSYTIASARPEEVSAYLSASDAGLAFIKPCFSKLASSPTKNAEYLACGLPVIINADVGDSDTLITVEKVGALVHRFDEEGYRNALDVVEEALADPDVTRNRSREVAERLFDVGGVGLTRYRDLYDRVISRPVASNSRRSVVHEQV